MKKLKHSGFALVVACCWMMAGNIAHADYVGKLNEIAGIHKISYWDLNEASGTMAADAWTTDTLDGDNFGTYSGGGVTVGVLGPRPADGFLGFSESNQAANFAGASGTSNASRQQLQMLDSASFNSLESLTMLMWFNIPNHPNVGNFQRHFGGFNDSTQNGPQRYGFSFNGNQAPRAYVRLQNDPVAPEDPVELSGNSDANNVPNYRDGIWHLLALTMEDSGADKAFKVYVDGAEREDLAVLISGGAGKHLANRHTNAANSVLAFGDDLGATDRRFFGRLDEIAFVGRALSSEDIGALWNSAFSPLSTDDGDFNDDGVIDAADYVFWRDTLGDDENYNLWKSTFGTTPGGAGNGSATAVPEPTAAAMLFCLAIGALGGLPRRWRRSP